MRTPVLSKATDVKIAIFYHCLFFKGTPPEESDSALRIVAEQMQEIQRNGLLSSAAHFSVGINGGPESLLYGSMMFPRHDSMIFHGLDSRNENSTIRMLEEWLPGHPGWAVLYFHAKGCTWPYDDYMRSRWRGCMMRNVVQNWRQCVRDLEAGFDSVGCHWMCPPATPKGHNIWAGTFWWATSDYLLTLPSIMDRDRIKVSGLKHKDSRYESEVWIGNGPRLPRVRDYHGPNWDPSKIATCLH